MPEGKENKPAALKNGEVSASSSASAFDLTFKALKAVSFYPENHPLRGKLLEGAYHAVSALAKEGAVPILVQRNGLVFADQRENFENSQMSRALAQELFAREIQRLTFLPDLTVEDFVAFLSLLALEPQKIAAAGGLGGMLTEKAVQSVVVNRIDISAVFTKRNVGETVEKEAADASALEEKPEQGAVDFEGGRIDLQQELTLEEALALMTADIDDDRYRQLARLVLTRGQQVKSDKDFDRLFTVIAALSGQYAEETRSAVHHQYALSAMQQLVAGEMTDHLLGHLEDESFCQADAVYLIFSQVGGEAVDAVVARLVAAAGKFSRERLTTALLRIGPPAVPALTALLQDGRWQVAHTAVSVLGMIGSREAVKDLAVTIFHVDGRVRMETIGALAKIGGPEATAVLADVVRDPNPAMAMHAVTWLGHSRNQRALPLLLQLVRKFDLLGKTQALKKEALVAIGRIGDRRALEPLCTLVDKRYLIRAGLWDELKVVAVEAIGNIGGEQAREFLETASARGGQLGRAASAALETMGQKETTLP